MKTVIGGVFATAMFPALCRPFFDAVAIGGAEGVVPSCIGTSAAASCSPSTLASAYAREAVPDPRLDLASRSARACRCRSKPREDVRSRATSARSTGVGTASTRARPKLVVRDLKGGRQLLQGKIPAYRLPAVLFVDNNIGGNLPYWRVSARPSPRCASGSAHRLPSTVSSTRTSSGLLARAGCRVLFTGLEASIRAAIADMRSKHQNLLDSIRFALDQCRRHGILVMSGLMPEPGHGRLDLCADDSGEAAGDRGCTSRTTSAWSLHSRARRKLSAARDRSAERVPAERAVAGLQRYTLVVRPERESVDDFVRSIQMGARRDLHQASQGEEARRGSSAAVCVGCLGIRDGGYRPSVLLPATRSRVRDRTLSGGLGRAAS